MVLYASFYSRLAGLISFKRKKKSLNSLLLNSIGGRKPMFNNGCLIEESMSTDAKTSQELSNIQA